MNRKVIASIMDVSFVKLVRTVGFDSVVEQFAISKVKRCLVYDPKRVVPKEKEKCDEEN